MDECTSSVLISLIFPSSLTLLVKCFNPSAVTLFMFVPPNLGFYKNIIMLVEELEFYIEL